MGKKKKGRRGGDDSGDESDTRSVAENEEAGEIDRDEEGELRDAIEELSAKRGATRFAALSKIQAALRTSYRAEFVAARRETMTHYLLAMLRKSPEEEVQAAGNILCLMALTLGAEHNLLPDLWPIAEPYIKNPAKPGPARAAVLEAVVMACFVGIQEREDVDDVLSLVAGTFAQGVKEKLEKGGPILTQQALESWSFLCTVVVSDARLGSEFIDAHGKTLVALLDHSSLDVRSAAGTALAMLRAAQDKCEEEKEDFVGPTFDLDVCGDKLSELANDSNRRKAKKERAKQRATFRDILRSFEDMEEPEETLTVARIKRTFTGWGPVLQLQAVRSVLEGGWLKHLQENELLAEIFGLYDMQKKARDEEEEKSDLGSVKRERLAQAQEQARHTFKNRQKERKKKNAFQSELAGDY